ncbi:MAG: winged helix-turn-helix domain-containing protein, partial [Saprospiraceae bacterium]
MSASQLADELGVSRQMIHRILKKLQEEELVQKLGKSPKTYYRLRHQEDKIENEIVIPHEKITFLENNFLFVSETGELYNGVEAMSAWCQRHRLPLVKTIDEFITTRKKYLAYKNQNGLISGLDKIKNTKG